MSVLKALKSLYFSGNIGQVTWLHTRQHANITQSSAILPRYSIPGDLA